METNSTSKYYLFYMQNDPSLINTWQSILKIKVSILAHSHDTPVR